ncbi:MAG: DsbE family thiol:disulfide interchange protein [Alphaproteobacteria bacterium]|nr:DsbE family thiol:disulfide interchange protein [Alphaproteobacteria bacterium]
MKRLLFALPVALFAAVVAIFAIGLKRDPSKLPSVLINQPLPAFVLPAVRPHDAGLSSMQFRAEPRLLNVFASWCVSCRVEHPVLLQLKAEGVPVDGLDWKDKASDGARYLRVNGDPYMRAGNDRSGRTGIDLGITGVPETFVIDARGMVRYKHTGPIAPKDWTNTIKPLMDHLRAES